MRLHSLAREQCLPITLETAWDFFSSPTNLDEITPDELGIKIVSPPAERMYEGQIITYRVKIPPGSGCRGSPRSRRGGGPRFVDEQRFGPYKFWHHRHEFEEVSGGVQMPDQVHYALPFGPSGRCRPCALRPAEAGMDLQLPPGSCSRGALAVFEICSIALAMRSGHITDWSKFK